jgi:serine protein kinase
MGKEEATMERTIFELIEAHVHTHCMGVWPGTFRDYLARVLKQPSLVQRAPGRLYTMLNIAGVYVDEEGKEHYAFCENDLLGIDVPLARVMEHFKAAAMGSDVRRRVLLFYGPSSSGKSQPVMLWQRGRKASTQTNAGAVYAVANCPQHAEPLNLLPHARSRAFQEETGLRVGGELCPLCALHLRAKYQDDFCRVPVQWMFVSPRERLRIGTFAPSDSKSHHISALVGSIGLSTVGDYSSESDPRAYQLDEVVETLVTREGYCTGCANELLRYVSRLQEK